MNSTFLRHRESAEKTKLACLSLMMLPSPPNDNKYSGIVDPRIEVMPDCRQRHG